MRALVLAICAAAICVPGVAPAWEATTTHAGLTERAALHSRLHQHLRIHLGLEQGIYAPLTVPPKDAPVLFKIFGTLNPTHGYVPDSRGRMRALGWLAAGSVVADIPAQHAAHHFFDPETGRGLSDQTVQGVAAYFRHLVNPRLAGEAIVRDGKSALEWLVDPQNPMGLDGFLDQYGKAISSSTQAQRSRHIAGTLLAAGALVHVLQDMGSPSHVRNDLAAHLETIGRNGIDVGSRFERIAALAFGRLGVPAPDRAITATSWQALFTAPDHSGLADRTSRRWFSSGTLPKSIRVRPGMDQGQLKTLLQGSLVRAHPAPQPRLDLQAAQTTNARLLDEQGVCVANYRIDDAGRLSWSLEDTCIAEQVAAILPEVASYSRGLLDWLFRGAITFDRAAQDIVIRTAGTGFGAGTLQLFWENGTGVRSAHGEPIAVTAAGADAVLGKAPAPPADARALVAVFQGQDDRGQPLVAAGYLAL